MKCNVHYDHYYMNILMIFPTKGYVHASGKKIRKNVGGVLLFNNDQCINPIGRVKRFYSVIKNELESS